MARARGRVEFNEDICKGCNLCVTACPFDILELDPDRINAKGYHPASIVDLDRCTGCAHCALVCPDLVIKVERI